MSNLSEEQIKDIANFVRYSIAYKDYSNIDIEKVCYALIGALDLYDEEKNKNRTKIIGKYGDVTLDEVLKEKYINKDKMRNKIKELKNIKPINSTEPYIDVVFCINVLKELLEE